MSKVSVIIPAYNMGDTIERTIHSVLSQTHSDLEVIVVDDGSTDDTNNIIRKLEDEDGRITYARQENRGRSSACNRGIKQVMGDFIVFLDADDTLPLDSIEKRVVAMESKPELDAVFANTCYLDEEGNVYAIKIPPKISNPIKLAKSFLSRPTTPFHPMSVMYTKKAFEKAGVFDHTMKRGQDIDLMIRLLRTCNVGYVNAEVYNYATGTHQVKKRIEHRLRGIKSRMRMAKTFDDPLTRLQLQVANVGYGMLKLLYEAVTTYKAPQANQLLGPLRIEQRN